MRQTILGKKLGMTQIFDQTGNAVPVTIVQAGPCTILQVKTTETDGYNAIQLGFGEKKEKHTTKPMLGHFKKVGAAPLRNVREAGVDDPSLFTAGQAITVGLFERGDIIDVTGTSKGKGFAGVMKRHGFKGFMASHGVHESKRGGGSIGQSADPAKVFKNMKMPGQMGDETVTIQNLRIVDIREDQNLLMIKGPIPGAKNGLLVISHAIKKDAPAMREITPEEPDTEPTPEPAEEDTPVEETAALETAPEEASPSADVSADESTEASAKAEADEAKEEATEDKPVEEAPVEEAPVEEAPVEEAPAEAAPEEAPPEEAPGEEASAEPSPSPAESVIEGEAGEETKED
jgi:large subunit ribosomal protein L3